MKKKLMFLLICMLLISIIGLALTSVVSKEEPIKNIKIVTSFYPMYTLTKNIIGDDLLNDDMSEIEIVNLTSYQTGCLHDYQLTTDDMKKLEDASVLIINGGGMEGFIEEIIKSYPDLDVINASEGISMLASEGHSHEENHDHENEEEHDHAGHNHEYNAHVWLNMDHYIQQVKNVEEGLGRLYPSHTDVFKDNSKEYQERVRGLQDEFKTALEKYKNIPLIIFHDAFVYLADELGLNIVHVVDIDEDSVTSLNARQVSDIINIVKQDDVRIILSEEQYSDSVAKTIADETKAEVYVVDTIVTGDDDKDAYFYGMRKNLEILKEVLKENKVYYD